MGIAKQQHFQHVDVRVHLMTSETYAGCSYAILPASCAYYVPAAACQAHHDYWPCWASSSDANAKQDGAGKQWSRGGAHVGLLLCAARAVASKATRAPSACPTNTTRFSPS